MPRPELNHIFAHPPKGNLAFRSKTSPSYKVVGSMSSMFAGNTAPQRHESHEPSESDKVEQTRNPKKARKSGSDGSPPGGYIGPHFSPHPDALNSGKLLWTSGIGAILSSGLALITHFSNKELFGPANNIIKPILTFAAILFTTIFGACWLTEPNSQSIGSTSIGHSTGSI